MIDGIYGEDKSMKATIIVSLIGVLGFGEDVQLVDKILFRKDSKLIAEKLNLIDAGKAIDEVTSLVQRLKKKGFTAFVFENAIIARTVEEKLKVEVSVAHPSLQGEILRKNMEKFAIEVGFVKQPQKLRKLTREVSVELTRLRVKKAGEKRDLMVAQAILSIDDLDKTTNLFMGRIREWYGLHFPELDRMIEKHETYARLVLSLGKRLNFIVENLNREGLPANKAVQIAEAVENSMGAELADIDIERIQSLCKQTLELYSLRQALQSYADSTVEEVAPNVQALVGSLLAARLIALAGGITNLAKMPASTIQVLGAEKALFRALKTGTRPPKHGIIFQDALIHDAKKWQRGKMSRALAGKLAIAARTDAFSNRYIGDSLKAALEKRVVEIKEKYQKPPSPKERKKKNKFQPLHKRRKKRGRRR
ncbi:MAG: C/D box methylation guide ribonucleoprotein complex aNOP56 subunit [Candidatus Bathyarchaeota archaeon]|nr:C/D box methylation guide ribonucleoprotein complex aNOP56 subunit [Candidatus Bathyarchaeota archaeon]